MIIDSIHQYKETNMKYKINDFIKFISGMQHHIYVKVDKNQKYPTSAMVAYSDKFPAKWDGTAQLYITVNPCRKMMKKPKISDVEWWTCEYIDLDCERPDHKIPATDEELTVLKPEIERINKWLTDHGFLTGYFDFTGNGWRWLLPVPPVDLREMKSKDVLKLNSQKKEWLKILKSETGTNIDTGVGELSRITGIPGTLNFKGHKDDRRREPFKGCERVEDVHLRDYIMDIEIKEECVERCDVNRTIDIEMFVNLLRSEYRNFDTKLSRASTIILGHRSSYDYSIAVDLYRFGMSESDAEDILYQYGTSRCDDKKYVKMTVRKVYMDGI